MQKNLVRPGRGSRARLAVLALLLGLGPLAWPSGSAWGAEGVVVNVNTATVEQLQALPGIGEARARAIVDARKARGGFKSVDELVEIRGIGTTNLERLRPHATVSGRTRIPEASNTR